MHDARRAPADLRRAQHPVALAAILSWLILASGARAFGQAVAPGGRPSASQHYALAMEAFEAGDFPVALDRFRIGAHSTLRTAAQPWIDSICFYTMIGECHARLGQLDEALDDYNTALRIHLSAPDWLLHAQFDSKVVPAGPNRERTAPWGKTSRLSRRGDVPVAIPISVAVPGTIAGEMIVVRVPEQVRCLAVCLMGRREVLGPVAAYDPFSREVREGLSQRLVRRGHWSEVWIDLLLGLAFEAEGNLPQARSHLEQSVVMEGVYDHHLTGVALLALGRLSAREGRPIEAGRLFEEASYAAYAYEDPRVLVEALRRAWAVHRQTGGGDPYAPLEVAVDRFRRTGPRLVHAELLMALTLDYLENRQLSQAQRSLAQTRSLFGRKAGPVSGVSHRLAHLESMLAFQKGDVDEAAQPLAEAIERQRAASPRRYQLKQADELIRANPSPVSTRDAMGLYALALAEPSPADWRDDPLDSLSWLTDSHEEVIRHWFELAWSRREYEVAFAVSELARRHRFLSTLPLGGRLLGLRWLLAVPAQTLGEDEKLRRRDLLLRFPEYDAAGAEWEKVEAALSQLPILPDAPDQQRQQRRLFEDEIKLHGRLERIEYALAALPEPVDLLFPPHVPLDSLRGRLEPGQAIWSFFQTPQGLYTFWLTDQSLSAWEIGQPENVAEQGRRLLAAMGHVEGSRAIGSNSIADEVWKTEAQEMLIMLMGRRGAEVLAPLEELIVVPDGVLWFVPFEALVIQPGAGSDGFDSLIGRLRMRYAPTASLGLSAGGRGPRIGDATLVVEGRLHPREKPTASEQVFQRCLARDPNVVFLPAPRRTFGAARLGHVRTALLWDELRLEDLRAMADGQTPADRGVALPALRWQGPRDLIVPGLRTPAETALRDAEIEPSSRQMFLTALHVLATGPRTVLWSRWRVGGDSTAQLVQEFAQELGFTTASDAWQRAVLLAAQTPLNPADEPRLELKPGDDAPAPRHPFFWAGYMLIDGGAPPAHRP